MINLLTLEEKKNIKRDYNIRLIIISLSFLLIIVVIAIAFLLPSYFLSSIKEKISSQELEKIKISQDFSDENIISEIIQETNMKLSLLSYYDNKLVVSKDIIEAILEKTKGKIEISEIYFTKNNNSPSTIDLKGTASSRESLLLFTEDIEREDQFSEVNLPVSNLVKNKDIKFNFNIIMP